MSAEFDEEVGHDEEYDFEELEEIVREVDDLRARKMERFFIKGFDL